MLSKAVGLSLLTSDSLYHRQQRRLAQPAFHHKRVQSYGESMVRITRQIMDSWQSGKVYDIDQQMMKITLYIVAKTLFNSDMSDETARAIGDSITSTQEFVNAQFQTLIAAPEWVPTRLNREFKQAKDTLRRIIMGIIEEHRTSGQDNGDLLSMLMLAIDEDNGQHMTDEQLLVESLGIIAAGHETTANALNFTWYLLSQNPDVEAKLHEELDRVLGGRTPAREDLPNLPYTSMVIKESMRLYPPAWAINRQPVEDTIINGHTIRKGEMIILSPYAAIHATLRIPNASGRNGGPMGWKSGCRASCICRSRAGRTFALDSNSR